MNNYESKYSRYSKRSNTSQTSDGAQQGKAHYSAPRSVGKNVWGQSQPKHTVSSSVLHDFSSSSPPAAAAAAAHPTGSSNSLNHSVHTRPFLHNSRSAEQPSSRNAIPLTSSIGYAAAVLNRSPKKPSSSQLDANASEFVMPGTAVQESTPKATTRTAWNVPKGQHQPPNVSYSQKVATKQLVSDGTQHIATNNKKKKKGSQQNQSSKSKKPKSNPRTLGGLADLTIAPNSSLRILKNLQYAPQHTPVPTNGQSMSRKKDNIRSSVPLTGSSGMEEFPSLPTSDPTVRIKKEPNIISPPPTPITAEMTSNPTNPQKKSRINAPSSSTKHSKPKKPKPTNVDKPSQVSDFFQSKKEKTLATTPFDFHSDNMLQMGVATKKGLRKMGPRKKKLTSLKKRILQERLLQYRKANGLDIVDEDSDVHTSSNVEQPLLSKTIVLDNFVTSEEVEDDEEYEEIMADLSVIANKVGPIVGTFIPRPDQDPLHIQGLAFVRFEKLEDSLAAKACWDKMIVGGNMIEVATISTSVLGNDQDLNWVHEVQLLSKNSLFQNDGEDGTASQTTNKPITKMTLCNVLTEDDYEDEDCLNETLSDIFTLAEKYGKLSKDKCFAETSGPLKGNICIFFEGDCCNASDLDGMVLGGQKISASFDHQPNEHQPPMTIHLENILNDADYEDHECLEETLEDIKQLASRYGVFESIHIELDDQEYRGRVSITYTFKHDALDAVKKFDGMIIGGESIKAYSISSSLKEVSATQAPTLVLSNILAQDDYNDEDCLEETKQDVLALVEKFGKVRELIAETDGTDKGNIIVHFNDSNDDVVARAVDGLDGVLFGGLNISVSMRGQVKESNNQKKEEPKKEETPAPLYSGGKIIPEQYAICKRVPKIPNSGIPRDYAKRIPDESAVPLLFEMLGELMRLQQRSKDDKNAKARRRLVMGLREVARGIRSHKVKMIIFANNVDEYGALDTKLQDILTLANEEDVPVIFELNKRKLGKALGKNIKISVVGVQNADGAYETFKKLKKLSLLAR